MFSRAFLEGTLQNLCSRIFISGARCPKAVVQEQKLYSAMVCMLFSLTTVSLYNHIMGTQFSFHICTCLYVYVCVYIYTYVSLKPMLVICVYRSIDLSIYLYTYIYIYICIYKLHICTCIYIYIYIYVYLYMSLCVHKLLNPEKSKENFTEGGAPWHRSEARRPGFRFIWGSFGIWVCGVYRV